MSYLCPACGYSTKVIQSSPYETGIKRRRHCMKCKKRFTTLETMIVMKRRSPWVVDTAALTGDNPSPTKERRDEDIRNRRPARTT